MTKPEPKPEGTPLPPGVPRPPTQADIDLISSQQGMVTDEWTGDPPPEPERPAG
ncbi:hypothetical protein GCM10011504_46250 [Siccirubricoccus deserti]|uniref:Uncharacterized protein n=1 Tax=Siccirubricoccus deserti TaxID=2013562 RepID=A0A9X0R433_9PROT|nr:hypothetical protein [Siccirubricoccus deserti]MBC4018063.1 hypothetical protein [Siccirubricoccus deserti]GGC62827.1 hypothetical protein GCM10011504_46250 [Siccirubricoccus deserti]